MYAFGETVTVVRPAQRDRTGDPTAAPAPHSLAGCAVAMQSTVDNNDARATVLSWLEMFCPPGADIEPGDEVTLPDGRTYLVDGQPATWRNPYTGTEAGVVVRLRGVF